MKNNIQNTYVFKYFIQIVFRIKYFKYLPTSKLFQIGNFKIHFNFCFQYKPIILFFGKIFQHIAII